MLNKVNKKIQEGFTLVEILIVVVIIGILAAIAIPTYFNYVEKAYASDAQTQIKTIFEECKIWRATHSDFPTDVQEMIDENASNISQSTLLKWQFEIDLQQSSESSSGIEGSIVATSTEKCLEEQITKDVMMLRLQHGQVLVLVLNVQINY